MDYMVTAPMKYVPADIKFTMKDDKNNRIGVIAKFVYSVPSDNKDFLSFLANDYLGIAVRKSMLTDSYNVIRKNLKDYEDLQIRNDQEVA